MAKLVFGMQQSLDGYVDHMKLGPPRPALFRHFLELVRGQTGMVYGSRMYEIIRNRGADSKGNASRSCWTIHVLLGCFVTLKCRKVDRLFSLLLTILYSTPNLMVGTVKKSVSAITS